MNRGLFILLQANINNPYPSPHPGTDLLKILAVLAVLATGIVVAVWPLLKENNIFSKEHPADYARSEYTKSTRAFTPMRAVALSFGLNIAEVLAYLYRNVIASAPVVVHNWDKDHHDYQPGTLFVAGLFLLVAAFIYTFVDESDFARFRDFKFALKVWLGAIILSPLVLIILYSFLADVANPVFLYFKFVAVVNGSCFGALGVLVWAADHFSKKGWHLHKKRIHIFYAAQAALLPCIAILAMVLHFGYGWLVGWLVYALFITLGIKYFDMETAVYSEATYYEAEVIDDQFEEVRSQSSEVRKSESQKDIFL